MVSWGAQSDYDINILGFSPRLIVDSPELNYFQNKFTIGADVYEADWQCETISIFGDPALDGLSRDTDVTRKSVAYYLQNELTLVDQLVLSTGYRKERAKYDYDAEDYNFWGGAWVWVYI